MILAPSLLSADLGSIAEEITLLSQAGIQWIHWDIMDGSYVPNITFGIPVMRAVRSVAPAMFFDTHLMIEQPERYVSEFCDAGAGSFVFHVDATRHPQRLLSQIRAKGMKSGVALCPHVSLSAIEYLIDDIDIVLLMSVNPGFSGQSFIESTLKKLDALVLLRQETGANFLIQMDGGIHAGNVATVVQKGVDVVVSGSSFFDVPHKTLSAYISQRELFEERAKTAI